MANKHAEGLLDVAICLEGQNRHYYAGRCEAAAAEITRLATELAAAQAKVEWGVRFKEWVINNLDPYEGWRGLVSMSRRVADWETKDAAQHPVAS